LQPVKKWSTPWGNKQPDLAISLPGSSGVGGAGGAPATTAAPFVRHYVDVAAGNVPAPAYAEVAFRGDVSRVLEAGVVSDYCPRKESHPEVVLHPFGLTNLSQLRPEATAFIILIKTKCKRVARTRDPCAFMDVPWPASPRATATRSTHSDSGVMRSVLF